MPKAAAASKTLVAAGCSQAMSWFLGNLGAESGSGPTAEHEPSMDCFLFRVFSLLDNEKTKICFLLLSVQYRKGRWSGLAQIRLHESFPCS